MPDEDLARVEAELPKHIELTQKEAGCLVFRVLQDPKDKNTFNVYEEFVNNDAFEVHQRRVKASRWGKITVSVKRHYQVNSGS